MIILNKYNISLRRVIMEERKTKAAFRSKKLFLEVSIKAAVTYY